MTDTTDPVAIIRARAKKQLEPVACTYPGTDAPILVRVLSEDEIDNAKIEAARYVKKRSVDLSVDPEFFDREVQRMIVWKSVLRSVVSAEGKHAPLFPDDSDVRALSSVDIEALWRLYLEVQEQKATTRHLSHDEIAKMAEATRRAPGSMRLQLSQLDHQTLVRMLVSVLDSPPPSDEPAST